MRDDGRFCNTFVSCFDDATRSLGKDYRNDLWEFAKLTVVSTALLMAVGLCVLVKCLVATASTCTSSCIEVVRFLRSLLLFLETCTLFLALATVSILSTR